MSLDEHAGQDRRPSRPFPAYRSRPVNPYIAGAPVSGPDMFYGRDDVFAFIRHKLIGQHRDTPIVLKGERRSGKTSVLYQVHRHLDPAYRCVAIDLHGLSLNGLSDLLRGIASSISDSLRIDHGLNIPPPGRAAFSTDPRSAFGSLFLPAVLAALGQDHLVLMLDEVARLDEEIRAGRLDREVFSYLRHLMQHYPRLNFIFSLGSGLEEMQKDYAFLFGAAMYHRISFLEEMAARKLITSPARQYYEVSPDAIDMILRVTSGHPYYTQLVCHALFDRWASRPPRPAMTAKDVHAVLSEAIELGSPNLTYVWEDSSDEEKAVMAAMAAAMQGGSHEVTGKAIRDAWRKEGGRLPERPLSAALRSLASREVISGTESYSFTVDLQRLWLAKHRRLDWLKDELAGSIRQWNLDAQPSRTRYLAAAAVLVVIIAGCLTAWPLLTDSANHKAPGQGSSARPPAATATAASAAQAAPTLSQTRTSPPVKKTPVPTPATPTASTAPITTPSTTPTSTQASKPPGPPTATIQSPSGQTVVEDGTQANGTQQNIPFNTSHLWLADPSNVFAQELTPANITEGHTWLATLNGFSCLEEGAEATIGIYLVPDNDSNAFSQYVNAFQYVNPPSAPPQGVKQLGSSTADCPPPSN